MVRNKGDIIDLAGRRRETNEQLLERLFNEHGRALRGFLRGLLGADDDLEDIVQELFLRLARLEDLQARLPREPGRWRSYLIAAANNLAVDLQRHRLVRRNYLETEQRHHPDNVHEASPEAIALTRQELHAVQQAITDMRPRWRQAFILNRFKYMSYRQIAREMGVSVKQVEKYMKSALIRVRDAAFNGKQEVQ